MATEDEVFNPASDVKLADDAAADVGKIALHEDAKTTNATAHDNQNATNEPVNGKPFKVLVAVDPTSWSAFAFDWYLKNIHRPEYEVVCYHTMGKPAVHGDEYCVSVEAFDAVMKGCESNAQDLHDDFASKMEEYKVNGRVVVQFSVIGSGEAIIEAALKERAQMIVVGSRGKGAVRRTLTGSVSDYVMRHAHCPVIVCCHERSRRRSSRLSSSGSISEDKDTSIN